MPIFHILTPKKANGHIYCNHRYSSVWLMRPSKGMPTKLYDFAVELLRVASCSILLITTDTLINRLKLNKIDTRGWRQRLPNKK